MVADFGMLQAMETMPISKFKATCLSALDRVRPPGGAREAGERMAGGAARHAHDSWRHCRPLERPGEVGGDRVNLLLDTHTWVWSHVAPERLTKRVTAALRNGNNDLWLSPISIWEFLLLAERGRL